MVYDFRTELKFIATPTRLVSLSLSSPSNFFRNQQIPSWKWFSPQVQ